MSGRNKNRNIYLFLAALCSILFSIFILVPAYSLSASSSNYDLVAVMPSVGITATSQGNIESRIEMGISNPSKFSYENLMQNYSGNIGLLEYFSNSETQSDNHVINLIAPVNKSGGYNHNIDFKFSVSNSATVDNCSLYVDNIRVHVFNTIDPGIIIHNENIPTDGIHEWNILCASNTGNLSQSFTKEFAIFSGFVQDDNESTNLSNVDITNVTNFSISKSSFGKIKFNGETDLSGIPNFGSHIIIGKNSIFVNSSAVGALNKSAELTFRNIDIQNPIILKDGLVCDSCTILSFSSGNLVISVSSFSNYSLTSSSYLEIFDETDYSGKVINDTIYFFANYTNASSGVYIPANCDISFNLGGWTSPITMLFNASNDLYYYNRTFIQSGSFAFNVSCIPTGPGYSSISLLDSFIVSVLSNTTGSFALVNLSSGVSSRFNQTFSSFSESGAGNVSEVSLNVTASSNAWQGYYGNISASLSLRDASGYNFYEWNNGSAKGQIFSSRVSNIDWLSINCSNSSSLENENNYIEKSPTDSDSVYNTFPYTNHPVFLIGSKYIQNCRSTMLNGINGPSSEFWNIILSDNDGGNNIVYAGFINSSSQGFNGGNYNFQLIVSENGNSGVDSITPYYFFIELD